VIVDSRGRVQSEIGVVPAQAGQDMVSTIDLDLQLAAEEQLAKLIHEARTIIAMDPNNGEILAMASLPSSIRTSLYREARLLRDENRSPRIGRMKNARSTTARSRVVILRDRRGRSLSLSERFSRA
jgi:cell division protein FtsI/penicillin-binding protein 2